jgi:hypothetical protein
LNRTFAIDWGAFLEIIYKKALLRDELVNRFTVRPRPYEGESLSGYLIRLSLANFVDCREILRYLQKGNYFKNGGRPVSYIDIYPELQIDYQLLEHSAGLSSMMIDTLSFKSTIFKFVTESSDWGKIRLTQMLNTKNRRFCPICLSNSMNYKLLWQVREIEICEVHKVLLTSTCSNCQCEQPYYAQSLGLGLCFNCSYELYHLTRESGVTDSIRKQLLYYLDWGNLLDPKFSFEHSVDTDVAKQVLAAKILYINSEQITNPPLTETYLRDLRAYIRGKKITIPLTIPMMIKCLRNLDMSLAEFANLQLPSAYIQRIQEDSTLKHFGSCIAPWCKSFNMNNAMVGINYNWEVQGKNFSKNAICMDCLMQYGYESKTHDWQSLNGSVDFVLKLSSAINAGKTISQCIEMGLGPLSLIQRFIGYLIRFELLSGEKADAYKPLSSFQEDEVFPYFREQLQNHFGYHGLLKAFRKVYRWSYKDLSFYYWTRSVQEYIYFNRYKDCDNLFNTTVEVIDNLMLIIKKLL